MCPPFAPRKRTQRKLPLDKEEIGVAHQSTNEDPSTLHVGTMPLRGGLLSPGCVPPVPERHVGFPLFYPGRGCAGGYCRPQRWQSAATIPVPSVWQAHGYDAYFYSDERYPFPYDPPYMPRENPCGVYQREFSWPQGEAKCYLNFDGVDSCFYLYVNGRFAAYSQVSHSISEVPIGKYLVAGKNRIQVLVIKWCDGSYLEDQDKIRLSGIFREVYLLFRDPIHITDLYVRATLTESFDRATVTAQISLTGSEEVAYSRCCAGAGTTRVAEGMVSVNGSETVSIEVDHPLLWSDETPYLYRLVLHCGNEYIRQEIGIRRFEIRDKVLYVNGKKVNGKGSQPP